MDDKNSSIQNRVPWSSEPSLKEMAFEVGIDFDQLIAGFEKDQSDEEISKELDVEENVVSSLRNHFYTRGIHSIMGQD